MSINFLVIIPIAAGLLAAWAGAEGTSKLWRRLGVPLLTVISGFFILKTIAAAFLLARALPMTLGYGIPDATDKGSAIGQFWHKIFKGQETLTAIYTRATIAAIECASIIIIPLATGHWAAYAIACEAIIATHILFGAIIGKEGTFKFFGKTLLVEEFLIHGANTLIINILLFACT